MIWYVLIGFIVAFFVLPVILAFAVYGTLACIISGVLIFNYRTHPRPAIVSEKELRSTAFYLEEELSALQSLKALQEECRSEKARIYLQGDRSKLSRRGQDGRFDARGQGKLLNAKLAKLDKKFETSEDQRLLLEMSAGDRRKKRVEEYNEWQSKRAFLDTFQAALVTYCASALLLVMIGPLWTQQLSQFVARNILLNVAAFGSLYGPLVAASGLAMATGLASQLVYGGVSIQFHSGLECDSFKENIAKFMEPEAITECDDSAETATDWETENHEDVSSPYSILGVSPSASRDQILVAYRELAKQYHPDFQQHRGPKLKELAEREMQSLNWAKEEALKRL